MTLFCFLSNCVLRIRFCFSKVLVLKILATFETNFMPFVTPCNLFLCSVDWLWTLWALGCLWGFKWHIFFFLTAMRASNKFFLVYFLRIFKKCCFPIQSHLKYESKCVIVPDFYIHLSTGNYSYFSWFIPSASLAYGYFPRRDKIFQFPFFRNILDSHPLRAIV